MNPTRCAGCASFHAGTPRTTVTERTVGALRLVPRVSRPRYYAPCRPPTRPCSPVAQPSSGESKPDWMTVIDAGKEDIHP